MVSASDSSTTGQWHASFFSCNFVIFSSCVLTHKIRRFRIPNLSTIPSNLHFFHVVILLVPATLFYCKLIQYSNTAELYWPIKVDNNILNWEFKVLPTSTLMNSDDEGLCILKVKTTFNKKSQVDWSLKAWPAPERVAQRTKFSLGWKTTNFAIS